MVYGTYSYSCWGESKPTFTENVWGHHCGDFGQLLAVLVFFLTCLEPGKHHDVFLLPHEKRYISYIALKNHGKLMLPFFFMLPFDKPFYDVI